MKSAKEEVDLKSTSETEKKVEVIGEKESPSSLSERCANLEESLEMMRAEFENMEDYWQVRKCEQLDAIKL